MNAYARSTDISSDQKAILERCFHPSGEWSEFTRDWLERSLPERFEEQVNRFPNRVAVKVGGKQLTYTELNQAANRVAHTLLARRGSGPEPIPLFFDHNVEFFVAMWGVLKAGKFYVPIDVTYPEERNRQILEDLTPSMLITSQRNLALAQGLCPAGVSVLELEECEAAKTTNLGLGIPPDAYAYIVFTSGSTSRPKGVIVDHQNVLHFSIFIVNTFHLCPSDRLCLTSSFSFNGAAHDFYAAFLSGAGLYPFDLKHVGAALLLDWLIGEEITLLAIVPTAFRQWAAALPIGENAPALRFLRLGGERVHLSDWEIYQARFVDRCIFRTALGTSEVKLITQFLMTKESHFADDQMPVGFPVDDVDVMILDEYHQIVPFNQVGEIALRSRFMSPGYWRRPDLTATKFLPDPEDPLSRIYLTGDQGVMRPDGCLYFLGRQDFQVKVRGYRVEVAEIESALMEMGVWAEVVVATQSDAQGEQRLVAWLVPYQSYHPTITDIRQHLAKTLPDYMLPHSFVFLPALPKTPAGKVNRQALPSIGRDRPLLANAYVPPRTPIEERVTQVWAEILELDQIGVQDSFFDLGGDSLKAMRVLLRLQELFPLSLHIQAMFDAPTVERLTLYLIAHYETDIDIELVSQSALPSGTISPLAKPGEARSNRVTTDDISLFRDILDRQRAGLPYAPNMRGRNPRAIFVLAPPRSGTTLLRAMLAGHPQLFAPPELYLLNYADLEQRRQVNKGRNAFRLEGSIRAIMSLYRCSVGEAQERMRGYERQGLSTQEFYRILQEQAGDLTLVDKTPVYASHPHILNQAELWFDEPLYIHLSRHPYGMINSFTSNHFHLRSELADTFAPDQLAELTWLVYHQNILAFLNQIPIHRQFHLRYEDLAKTPDVAMRRICAFLDLDFDPATLTPYADSQIRMTDGIYPESIMIGDPNFHHFSSIDPSSINRWQGAMDGSNFLSTTSKMLAQGFGYENL